MQTDEIRIRTAVPKDIGPLRVIMRESQEEHAARQPDVFAPTDEILPAEWFNMYMGKKSSQILVAEREETIIGFAMLEMKKSMPYKAFVQRKYAQLNEFGVLSDYQRSGVGRLLFKACRDWASSRQAVSLELQVWEFNARALSFYEAMGMETLNRTLSTKL